MWGFSVPAGSCPRGLRLLLHVVSIITCSGFALPAAKIAVVTGGNRGIGLEICRQLLEREVKVILTARSVSKGKKAAESLGKHCSFLPLDVTDKASIDSLTTRLKKDHGEIDIIVNNAAMSFKGNQAFSPVTARKVIETNCYGARDLTAALLPLMRRDGRVVFVSSRSGGMWRLSKEKQELFWRAGESDPDLDTAIDTFISDTRQGRWREGWPSPGLELPYIPGLGLPESGDRKVWLRATELGLYFTAGPHHTAYCVAKAGMNAVARRLAAEAKQGIQVNACCPGWVRTEMAGSLAPSSIAEGASTPVYLACLEEEYNGQFFAEKQPIDW